VKSNLPHPRDEQFADEFARAVDTAFDRVTVNVFLCGKGLLKETPARRDIRLFLRSKLESEVKNCRVKLGEHRTLMRSFKNAAGERAFNLADHEFALARTIDLLVIFPCSPGSFAELGMFCLQQPIAAKMAIFLSSRFRKGGGFIVEGPVAAAEIRRSRVFRVDYSDRATIWKKVRDMVLDLRVVKGREKLLSS
jgi:hypothetical protein